MIISNLIKLFTTQGDTQDPHEDIITQTPTTKNKQLVELERAQEAARAIGNEYGF